MKTTPTLLAGLLVLGAMLGGCGSRDEGADAHTTGASGQAVPEPKAVTGRAVTPGAEAEPVEPAEAPLPPEPAPPVPTADRKKFGFPEHYDLPADARPLPLPPDVPVPQGAEAISEPMRTEQGFMHATYAVEGSAAAVQTQYTTNLLAQGWAIQPASGNASDKALVTATKGNRQLVIAIETIEGQTQMVLVEMENPTH